MGDPITKARARLARARQHVDTLGTKTKNFFDGGACSIERRSVAEGEGKRVTLTFKVHKQLPAELGFIFGDAVHNIRSVCDSLVVAIGEKERVSKAKRLSMPVCVAASMEKGLAKNQVFDEYRASSTLSPGALDLIESVQPFNEFVRDDGYKFVGFSHPMYVLNRLWNEDKHRTPLEVEAIKQSGIILGAGGAVQLNTGELVLDLGERYTDGQVMFSANVPVDTPLERFAPIGEIHVMTKQVGDVTPRVALFLLADLHNYVAREVVDKFAPLLS